MKPGSQSGTYIFVPQELRERVGLAEETLAATTEELEAKLERCEKLEEKIEAADAAVTKRRSDLIEMQEAKERVVTAQREASVKKFKSSLGKKISVDESEKVVSKPPVPTAHTSFAEILKLSRAAKTDTKSNTEIGTKKVQFSDGKSKNQEENDQRLVDLKEKFAKLKFQIRSCDHNKSSVLDNCARISLSNSVKISPLSKIWTHWLI